jgi:hypothetical protein
VLKYLHPVSKEARAGAACASSSYRAHHTPTQGRSALPFGDRSESRSAKPRRVHHGPVPPTITRVSCAWSSSSPFPASSTAELGPGPRATLAVGLSVRVGCNDTTLMSVMGTERATS